MQSKHYLPTLLPKTGRTLVRLLSWIFVIQQYPIRPGKQTTISETVSSLELTTNYSSKLYLSLKTKNKSLTPTRNYQAFVQAPAGKRKASDALLGQALPYFDEADVTAVVGALKSYAVFAKNTLAADEVALREGRPLQVFLGAILSEIEGAFLSSGGAVDKRGASEATFRDRSMLCGTTCWGCSANDGQGLTEFNG